jgi:DNA-binding SARP family transcriptional activator
MTRNEASTWEFGLLGPLVVKRDGEPVAVGGARQRSLLVRLLVDANTRLSTSRLVEDVWNDRATSGSGSTLQSYVFNLRQRIGSDRIVTVERDYMIVAGNEEIDARTFEADTAEANLAWRDGDVELAEQLYRRGLDRWRGLALEDVAGADWAIAESVRLDELRASCLERWLRCRSDLGYFDEVIAAAEAAIAVSPLREGLWGVLMLALYRTGRQSDALRAYRRLKAVLADELGIDPGRAVAELELAILQQKGELDPPTRRLHRGALVESRPEFFRRMVSDFVGRINELDAIEQALVTATGGRRGLLLISGEAGIGKTQLALRAAQGVEEKGGIALYGRCSEGALTAYQPFVEALARLDDQGSVGLPSARRTIMDLAGPYMHAWDKHGLATHEHEAARLGLFDAVDLWVVDAARGRHLCLILDDMHLADRGTVSLLDRLLSSSEQLGLLAVVAFQEGGLVADGALLPFVVRWQTSGLCLRLHLDGLDLAEIQELLNRNENPSTTDGFEPQYLLEMTDGNPFFLRQVLQSPASLQDRLRRRRGESGAVVPAGVRDLVVLQMQRLNALTREVLEVGSVCGGRFTLSVLERVTGRDDETLIAAIESALRAQLVRPVPDSLDEYSFSHGLVHRAIYEGLSPSRAVRLHHRVAVALEAELGASPSGELLSDLAYQFVAGSGVAAADKAVTYSMAAASEAMLQFAYETAAEILLRALDVQGRYGQSPAAAAEMLVMLGQSRTGLGEVAEGKDAFARAADLADQCGRPDLLAAAASGFGGPVSIAWASDEDHVTLLRRALAAPQEKPVRARLEGRLAQSLCYRGDSAEPDRLSADALALARETADETVLAECLVHRFWAIYSPARAVDCHVVAQQAFEIGERIGDPELRIKAAQCVIHSALELGQFDEATDAAEAQRKAAVQLRQPQYRRLAEINDSMMATLRGRFEEGRAMAEAARDSSLPRSQGEAFIVWAAQLCTNLWLEGRLEVLLDAQIKANRNDPERAVWQASLCWIYAETGQPESGRRFLGALLHRPFEDLPVDLHWWPTVVGTILCVHELRDLHAAARLAAVIEPLADHMACIGQAAVLGSAHHYLGLMADVLDDTERARRHLEVALSRHEAINSPPLQAITQLALAQALSRSPSTADRDDAARLTRAARATAERYGMARVVRRCQELAGAGR